MKPAPECPAWLSGAARRLLRLRLPPDRIDEAQGDLRELWTVRRAQGRRDLRRALIRDLIGLLRYPPPQLDRPIAMSRRIRFQPRAVLHGLGPDLRHAARLISRQPVFAGLAVATLTLGIAGSTTIFSAIERLLLRPLPYPSPESIVAIDNPLFSFSTGGMASHPAMLRTGVLVSAGLYATGGLNLDGGGDPVRVRAAAAEPGMFDALGVPARLGRTYTSTETLDTAAPVAVISDGLWRRAFGGRHDVLEQSIDLNRRRFRITGVMPPGFTFPDATDVWIPPFTDRQLTGDAFAPEVVGRLAAGIPAPAAEAALQQLLRDRGAPADRDPLRVRSLQDELTRQVRPMLLVLGVAVALVLLVSCSNVAGLLLSRVSARQSEFVVRRALGGSRWRLARQLLIESALLALIAGVAGASLSVFLIRTIPLLLDRPIPDVDISALDSRLLLIALALSTITGLIFGLAPAVAAGVPSAAQALRTTTTSTPGRTSRRLRQALVAAQVAAALVLLVVTGSTIDRLRQLSRIDLGFDDREVIGLDVTLPIAAYAEPRAAIAFFERASERLGAIPGVTAVAASGRLPGDRSIGVGLALRRAGEPAPEGAPAFASMLTASPGYFAVMGIPLRAGRPFSSDDGATSPAVVILSESAAAALWPDPLAAVGRFVAIDRGRPIEAAVVGVAADVRLHGPDVHPRNLRQLYRPLLQSPPFGTMAFVVKSAAPAGSLAPAFRTAIASADPHLPIASLVAMPDVTTRFLSAQRLSMTLMSSFALVALVMAAIGLYGVLSSLVAQQTREIGIRVALGADRSALRRTIVLAGLRLAMIGIIAGAIAAGSASTLISRFVPMLDPPTWTAIGGFSLALAGAAVAAAWVPARRASALDPLQALRAE